MSDYQGSESEVIVPATIEEKEIVRLDKTFRNKGWIKSVTISEGIQVIGEHTSEMVHMRTQRLTKSNSAAM